MAKPTGETKTPVLIALVFFILSTLILGVLTYMYSETAGEAKSAEVKAAADKKTAEDALAKQNEINLLHKAALGILTDDEKTTLQTGVRFKDDLRKAHETMTTSIKARADLAIKAQQQQNQVGGNLNTATFFSWDWPAGAEVALPRGDVLDNAVRSASQRALAEKRFNTEEESLKKTRAELEKYSRELDATTKKFQGLIDSFPTLVREDVAKATEQFKQFKTDFEKQSGEYRKTTQQLNDTVAERDAKLKKSDEQLSTQRTAIDKLQERTDDKVDPFQYDRPHGKVIRRYSENLVDIDLGSSAGLRSGQTFSIFPSDTPTRGFGSRMRETRELDGSLVSRPAPKGKIEVIDVLGATLSTCRITDEESQVRDRILSGDLLYNSIWKRGSSEHVILFGIFDLDGDGRDDVQNLVTELGKAGVVVDGFYDLSKAMSPDAKDTNYNEKFWAGRGVNSQTVFAIEGYSPQTSLADGNSEGKIKMLNILGSVKKELKERGVRILRPRDFFPRIGFTAKLDVTQEAINQAATFYLRTFGPPADGTAADPGK